MGNIATYETGGEKITYTYDAQGQLLKAVGDETYTYGNTNWRDLLTGYGGKTVTSDTAGNMLSDGTWTYSGSMAGSWPV